MNHIFYLIGKSSSGKDTLYSHLVDELGLFPIVLYTTRPIRSSERDGVEYHFVDSQRFIEMKNSGMVIEHRTYSTVFGEWSYFTASDSISLEKGSCIGIGTLESYKKIREYFGSESVVPVYIEVDDNIRFLRAVGREKAQPNPMYLELCRRFVADSTDFSEEKLAEAGIKVRFDNSGAPGECLSEIKKYIRNFR